MDGRWKPGSNPPFSISIFSPSLSVSRGSSSLLVLPSSESSSTGLGPSIQSARKTNMMKEGKVKTGFKYFILYRLLLLLLLLLFGWTKTGYQFNYGIVQGVQQMSVLAAWWRSEPWTHHHSLNNQVSFRLIFRQVRKQHGHPTGGGIWGKTLMQFEADELTDILDEMPQTPDSRL